MSDVDTVWRRSEDVLTRRTARSLLVLSAGASEPLKLEGAAISVWDHLREPATDAQLVDAIAAHFGVSGDAVSGDVVAVRAALRDYGALVGDA